MKTTRTGHLIAWGSFVLGVTVSVAANVEHARLSPAGPAELVGAAFWPLALLLTIEVLTRVVWPTGNRWALARFGGVGLVGAVAAILSYRHMQGLLTAWGEDPLNAYLGPLAVDGLMLISATALLAISRGKQAPAVDDVFRPLVHQWPVPIGPHPADGLVKGWYADNRLSGPPEADEEMLGRILAGIPDTDTPPRQLITLQAGDRRHTGHSSPIGPPRPRPTSVEPKPKPRPAKPAVAQGDGYDEAYRFWQSNPDASGGDLAKQLGIPRSTAGRWLKEWRNTRQEVSVS